MDRILIILKKENGPRASSAPALGLNTIIFNHVYWYMQQTQVSIYRTIGPLVAYAKTKAQISCAVTVQRISTFVFATWVVQSLSFLNSKFQTSRLYRDCTCLCRNLEDCFSRCGSYYPKLFFCVKVCACQILLKQLYIYISIII